VEWSDGGYFGPGTTIDPDYTMLYYRQATGFDNVPIYIYDTITGTSGGVETDYVYIPQGATITVAGNNSWLYKYNINAYNVTFDLNGAPGTQPATQSVGRGYSPLAVTPPTWTNYNFLGWSTSQYAVTGSPAESITITQNTTLYAIWKYTLYNVSYNTNGGNTISATLDVNALPNPLPTPTKEGYNFIGWYYDSELTSQAIAGAPISADTTLYAKWTANTYNIYWQENGGTTVSDLSNVTALPSPLPTPTKTGYNFLGWYYDSAFTTLAVAGTTIDNDVVLYAKWQQQQEPTYTITYDTMGGEPIAQQYNMRALPNPLPAPTREGYAFQGWYYYELEAKQFTIYEPIAELNNHTLREVFENNPLNTNAMFNTIVIQKNIPYYEVQIDDYTASTNYIRKRDEGLSVNHNFYGVFDFSQVTGFLGEVVEFYDQDLFSSMIVSSSGGIHSKTFFVKDILHMAYRLYGTDSLTSNAISKFNAYLIDLDLLGITPTTNMDYYYSLYKALKNSESLPNEVSNNFYTNDDAAIYLAPLKASKQYSPIYDTTFDLMSDAEIKTQMDFWVQNGTPTHVANPGTPLTQNITLYAKWRYIDPLDEDYIDGYNDGYATGYGVGYWEGYEDGKLASFDEGYTKAMDELGSQETGLFWLTSIATSIGSILALEIFPSISIGLLIFIPFAFGLLFWFLKLLKGGGD
jgi:uncharacterized repeat protein (TIGR02543 family)